MDQLPVELLTKIIDYLPPHEQVKLQSVSKRFLVLARDNSRWRLHCYRESWAGTQGLGTDAAASSSSPTSLSLLGQGSFRSLIQQQQDNQIGEDGDGDSDGYGGGDGGHSQPRRPTSRLSSYAKRSRAVSSWDPSYEMEEVDWYSEYIARHGPTSLTWLQQPYENRDNRGRRKEFYDVKGMGLLRDWSSAGADKVVAPLENGSVCVWDLSHSHSAVRTHDGKGRVIGMSSPGMLTTDMSRSASSPPSSLSSMSKRKPAVDFINVGECVSVDSIRRRAYLAVGSILNEVDLETLKLVSQQRYPWSIFALSQETDYSVPLTLATTLSLQIYDSRLSVREEEEAISLRCEKEPFSFAPDSQLSIGLSSPLLQLRPDGRPPHRIRSLDPPGKDVNYAPLFQPNPLSILHPPAPHINSILLAGRFPSILCYDRRYFPRLQNAVHSGGGLCSLASFPAPRFPIFSDSTWPKSHNIVACGEYNGRGSLEFYNLSSSSSTTTAQNPDNSNGDNNDNDNNRCDISDTSSNLSLIYRNRQSAARSKLLSVQSHGTRLVYSDAEGNIKWTERDGRVEVRRFNINTYQLHARPTQQQNQRYASENDPNLSLNNREYGISGGGLWSSSTFNSKPNEVARRILPTGGNLVGDELLIWTGERIGRVRFSCSPSEGLSGHGDGDESEEDDDDDMSIDAEVDEATREQIRQRKREERQREREYAGLMRRALERQADEVRWLGALRMVQ